MIKGGNGGTRTTSGLDYENRTELATAIKAYSHQYSLAHLKWHSTAYGVDYEEKRIATLFKKAGLYKFLEQRDANYTDVLSQKLYPDSALVFNGILYIFEIKFQAVPGSVDEKLQTCDHKRRQYAKLASLVGLDIEYTYILNDWFNQPRYRDVLAYINDVGCNYFYNGYPLQDIGLPGPDKLRLDLAAGS